MKKNSCQNGLGIYVHIPFCIRKCLYCDFLSFSNCGEDTFRAYTDAVCKEIQFYGEHYCEVADAETKAQVDTIFIGGGTPTMIPADFIANIMSAIKEHFHVSEDAEISIESNPKTLTEEKLMIYKAAGINRLSMGVQSLDDSVLKKLGRVHGSSDAHEAFELARRCGFDNINLDLMFAVPGQDMDIWKKTLDETIDMSPEHISFYSLQLEEGTEFFKMFEKGDLPMLSDEADRQMYHYAVDRLKSAGYEHYEISNCAKAGKECRHNIKYWSLDNYLGVGLGSHSYMNGCRFSNETDLKKYIKVLTDEEENLSKENASHSTWVEWAQENTLEDDISDYVITAMRRMCGINFEAFETRFGKKFFEVYPEQEVLVEEWSKRGFLEVTDEYMRFTILGVDVSNTILAEFV